MNRLLRILRAPGGRRAIECAAPTQVVENTEPCDEKNGLSISAENINTYTVTAKAGLLDRWLDKVVKASGSELIYFTIVIALFIWAFLGIRFGKSNTWQVTISDAQAIVNMVFDAFLMRQQLNSHESLMVVAASLRSRASSHKRLLNQLIRSGKCTKIEPAQFQELQQKDFASELPKEDWLGRISTALSAFMGHIATVFGFWVCIFIWVGFGKYCNWSNT
jgi:low-affinity ferrous iron transport protein